MGAPSKTKMRTSKKKKKVKKKTEIAPEKNKIEKIFDCAQRDIKRENERKVQHTNCEVEKNFSLHFFLPELHAAP